MFHYKGKDIRDIVNDSEWQNLRKSFIGTWSKNSVENVNKLRKYLGDMKDEMKLVRVLNYLTGTAFRLGSISSPEIEKLLNEVRQKLRQLR